MAVMEIASAWCQNGGFAVSGCGTGDGDSSSVSALVVVMLVVLAVVSIVAGVVLVLRGRARKQQSGSAANVRNMRLSAQQPRSARV